MKLFQKIVVMACMFAVIAGSSAAMKRSQPDSGFSAEVPEPEPKKQAVNTPQNSTAQNTVSVESEDGSASNSDTEIYNPDEMAAYAHELSLGMKENTLADDYDPKYVTMDLDDKQSSTNQPKNVVTTLSPQRSGTIQSTQGNTLLSPAHKPDPLKLQANSAGFAQQANKPVSAIASAQKLEHKRVYKGFTHSLKNDHLSLCKAGVAASLGLYGLSWCVADPTSTFIEAFSYLIGVGTVATKTFQAMWHYLYPVTTEQDRLYDEIARLTSVLHSAKPKVDRLRKDIDEELKRILAFFQAIKENLSVADTRESLEVSLERQNQAKEKSLKMLIDWLGAECRSRVDHLKLLDCQHQLSLQNSKNNIQMGTETLSANVVKAESELKKSFIHASSAQQAAYKLMLERLVDAEIAYYQALTGVIVQQ